MEGKKDVYAFEFVESAMESLAQMFAAAKNSGKWSNELLERITPSPDIQDTPTEHGSNDRR
ncbi:MAG TPA: hypothetical protein VI387_04915 [Candidatus Brocadiales bacterium]|nr:hypothetical protein [Candidatus Brocadiales bacterium]